VGVNMTELIKLDALTMVFIADCSKRNGVIETAFSLFKNENKGKMTSYNYKKYKDIVLHCRHKTSITA
jgi:hypothetical protein